MKKTSLSVSAPLAITLTTGLLIGGFAGAANAAPVTDNASNIQVATTAAVSPQAMAPEGQGVIQKKTATIDPRLGLVEIPVTGLPANARVAVYASDWTSKGHKYTTSGGPFIADEQGNATILLGTSNTNHSLLDRNVMLDENGDYESTFYHSRGRDLHVVLAYDTTGDNVFEGQVPGRIDIKSTDTKPVIDQLPSDAYVGQTVDVSGSKLLFAPSSIAVDSQVRSGFDAAITPKSTWTKHLLGNGSDALVKAAKSSSYSVTPLQDTDQISLTIPSAATPGVYNIAAAATAGTTQRWALGQNPYIYEAVDQERSAGLTELAVALPDNNHTTFTNSDYNTKLGLKRDFTIYGASLDNTLGTEQGGNIIVTGSDYRPGDTVTIDVAGQSITTTVLSSGVFMAFIPTTTDTPVGDQTVTVTVDGAPTRTGSVEITEKYIPADGKDGLDGKDGIDGQDGEDGTNGTDGKSAYEIAVEGGFEGTEAEWLESLIGANGSDGQQGKSAYEIAVEGGFEGTEKEWLESLQGTNGSDGKDGKDGLDGENGKDGVNGEDGKPGKDGKDGLDGQPGLDGEDGTNGLDGKPGEDGLDGTNGQDGINGKDAQTPAPVDPTNKPADPAGNTDNGGNKTPAGTTDNGAVIKPVANVEKTGTEAPKPVTDGTEQVKINSGIAQDKAPLVYGGLAALAAAAAGAFALFRKRKPAVENNNHGDTSGN